jgi:uncharacterized phosphosugar-binding protein
MNKNITSVYLENLIDLLRSLLRDEDGNLEAAAQLIAKTIRIDGVIHAFGTGHSHMLVEELFYRAGGLANVNPILDERLMLHLSATDSTTFERTPGLAAEILSDHTINSNDVFIIASNSGGNTVIEEMASDLVARQIPIIAITSLKHANSSSARVSGTKLHDLADIVIDNLGIVGDASISVGDIDVGPTSSVIGCSIVNSISGRAVEILVESGFKPTVFMSSNTEYGDKWNSELLVSLKKKLKSL